MNTVVNSMSESILEHKHLIEQDLSSAEHRKALMHALYKDSKLNRQVHQYVLKNGGNKSDAHDVLSDAIIGFVLALSKGKLETIMHTPDAYFAGVVKYSWFGILRKRKRLVNRDRLNGEMTDIKVESHQIGVKIQLEKLLKTLEPKCREVLRLWSLNYKMREIALRMSYSSEQMAKKKKYLCLKRLKEILDRMPALKRELKDR